MPFLIGYIKGESAIHANLVAGNETSMEFWARGYAVSTVGFEENQVRKYIREQEALERNHGKF